MLSRTVVLEPTPQDPSRLAGRVHPYLRLEPWAGLSSSSQGPLPKYLKAMTWLSMCSHIPHPIGPIQQPLEVCRASFIVPVYRSRQQMTLDMPRRLPQVASHRRPGRRGRIPTEQVGKQRLQLSLWAWAEEWGCSPALPPRGPGLHHVWSGQLRRQWAGLPEHSRWRGQRPPTSEAEEQLGAHYRPSMTAFSLDESKEEHVGLGSLKSA